MWISLRRAPFIWLIPPAVWLASACGSEPDENSNENPPSGVFGGSGGVVQPELGGAGPEGGTGGDPGGLAEVCGNVPAGSQPVIDDFEDGDSIAVFEASREAYWFTMHDESAGSLAPDGEFVPVEGGAGSSLAAHVTASGYSLWGAALAANITHYENGIRCPYDASKFSGLRFYAKGSGKMRVVLSMPGVVDVEFGGTCDPSAGETCYDQHGVWIELGPEWTLHQLEWSEFVQRNFGKVVQFDPGSIMSLQFTFEVGSLPVDAWIDEVRWEDGSPPLDLGGQGGQGGAGSIGSAGAGGSGEGGVTGQGGP